MSETTPKTIEIRGETFRCIDALPPGLLMDIAEVTNTDERNPADVMRTIATIGRFLKAAIVPEDRGRYDAIVYDTRTILGIDDLAEIAGGLIRQYAGRPTVRPSESPDGLEPTGQISRVVSFSPATEPAADPSLTAGASSES